MPKVDSLSTRQQSSQESRQPKYVPDMSNRSWSCSPMANWMKSPKHTHEKSRSQARTHARLQLANAEWLKTANLHPGAVANGRERLSDDFKLDFEMRMDRANTMLFASGRRARLFGRLFGRLSGRGTVWVAGCVGTRLYVADAVCGRR